MPFGAPPPLARRAAPPLWPREEPPVPVAQLPPKKRWLWLSWTQAAAAAPPPAIATQIHATMACAAATDALALPVPAPATALQADAAASPSPAAAQKRRSSPVPPLAGDLKPHAPPPPPSSADGKPLSTPPPAKRVRKVVKKVRKVVKRLVPKGTTSTSASAAAAGKETSNTNAASLAAASAAAAGASPLHLLAAVVVAEEGHEPGEFVPETEKPAGDCKNAAGAGGKSSPGDETAVELEAKVAGEEPPVVEKKPVVSSSKKGGAEKDGTVMRSGRKKKMTAEVFVGGLDRDATEEDVRAALAEAGEIAEVRMIRDAQAPAKNKGYCFVRYSEPAQARKAVAKFGNVKICGKQCGVEAVERNDKVNPPQGDPNEGYTQIYYGEKPPFSTLGDNSSYFMSHDSSAPNGSNAYAMPISSYGASPYAIVEYPPLYHHGSNLYLPDSYYYGPAEPWNRIPMRQASSRKPGQPRGGSRH